ncbi:MAG TPA: ATP-binding protein [Symbiobacteriaceae bacterium]
MLDFMLWMFVNLMVAMGLGFIAVYPPPFLDAPLKPNQFDWRYVAATSVMAIFCMIYPYHVSAGIQIDLRTVVVGLSGWTRGWPTAALIGLVVLLVRFWMGGAGVSVAVLTMAIAVALVPFFKGRPRTLLTMGLMGFLQAAGLYVGVQVLLGARAVGLGPLSPDWLLIAAVFTISPWVLHYSGMYARKKRELEIKYAAELRTKEALLELIPYGIVFLDAQRNLVGFNQAARSIMDGDRVPAAFFDHPEIDQALREQKRISHCRVVFPCRRYSDECIVLVSAVPLRGGGTVLGIENVTRVVRQEREEAMRDRLEMLGRLAATAAHEIKNPLTTIKGFMQLLASKSEFAPHRSAFTLVQGEADHINRVVSDLLELAGHGTDQTSRFGLDDLLLEVLKVMELQFPESGVLASVAGVDGLVLTANRKSVKQILKNLVANAYEALPSGGQLTVLREPQGDGVAITVADTGSGIAPDMLPLIFTPYMTTKATGTGLGLAISHKLALDMGGRLEVASQVGRGSSFCLTLPPGEALVAGAAAALMKD